MTLRKATIKKEGDQWVAEYESDAIPTIEGKSTQKHPEIKVDIGMKLEPTKVRYPADKYPLDQVVENTKSRLETDECEMCMREQKVVAAFISGLYTLKDERAKLLQEKQAEQKMLPEGKEEPKLPFPFFSRPSIIGGLIGESKKEN